MQRYTLIFHTILSYWDFFMAKRQNKDCILPEKAKPINLNFITDLQQWESPKDEQLDESTPPRAVFYPEQEVH